MVHRRFSVNLTAKADRQLAALMEAYECNQQDAISRAVAIAATLLEVQGGDKELMLGHKATGSLERLVII